MAEPGAATVAAPGRTAAPTTTTVEVTRPGTPGGPVRVTSADGLLAVRTVSRGPDRAEVALVATGAVLLGGDHVVVRVRVGAGCALRITDVGGTVAYDADGVPSRWDVEIELDDDARLEWYGMPFVVCDGADVARSTTARLGPRAGLVLRETVVLGRHGERGGRVVVRSAVSDDTGPLLVEDVDVCGAAPVPGVLGGHRVLDTLSVLDGTDERAGSDRSWSSGALAGALPAGATTMHLECGGTVTRWLGDAAHLSPIERRLGAGPPFLEER
ncbi:urease accessory protein UreD [Isoptericola sp. BMS4]|uniref:urease accessory protein UreD n=1 Tax=Isoptericola sp. BMS4 TaxID=2527875 RepID=UPI00141E64C2|nr:urease accessory protein UreD [Isoptericola sp. BMS4]